MNWIETLLIVLVVISVIMTLFTEPKLSFQYFKACSKSGVALVRKGLTIGKGIIGGFMENSNEGAANETLQVQDAPVSDD